MAAGTTSTPRASGLRGAETRGRERPLIGVTATLLSFPAAHYRLSVVMHPRCPHSLRAAWLAWLGLGALLWGAGCGSTSVPRTGDLEKDLRHEDPRVRAQAAKGAVEAGRQDLLPLLVENLADHDAAVRMFSAIALRKLTGQDFGYDPSDPAFEREKAIMAWRQWIDAHGQGAGAREKDGPQKGAAPDNAPTVSQGGPE